MTGSPRGLLALIREGESETLEFKESLRLMSVEEITRAAMGNMDITQFAEMLFYAGLIEQWGSKLPAALA